LDLFAHLRAITAEAVAVNGQAEGAIALSWIAGDYLRLATLALLAWSWTQIDQASAAHATDAHRWQAPATALRAWVLPEFGMRAAMIRGQFTAT
jgi:hypothetical protein